MCARDFEGEVYALMQRGDLHLDLPAMRAVGYQQMWRHLAGEYDKETMIDRGIIATRQLAKRQLTWLRQRKTVSSLEMMCPEIETKACQIVSKLISKTR